MKHNELHINFTETNPEDVYIKAELKPDSKSYEIFFRSNDISLTKNTEALLSVGFLPAMKTRSTLVAEGVISQRLFNAIEPINNFFHTLNPHLKKIKINKFVPQPAKPPKENRVGVFFSAGVDSFYSLLKNKDEITDLIFIHGFDFSLTSYSRREKMSKMIREIGLEFDKRVIEIETNMRSFIQKSFKKPKLPWIHAYGAVLASVGHLLFPFFRRLFIPSSSPYADNYPPHLGSHPDFDPLWSTEALDFIHDGCEATRIDKVAFIAQSEIALKNLQVCRESTAIVNKMAPLKNISFQADTENTASVYNCGLCEKCIRTMINLYIVGALDRCPALPNKLDLEKISQATIHRKSDQAFLEENLRALENRRGDQDLYNALHKKMLKQPWWVTFEETYPRWIYRILRSMGRFSGKF